MRLRDEAIADLVRCRLAEDDRISGLPIDVFVDNSDVYVRGVVDSEQQRKTLELIISGLAGVHDVILDRVLVRFQR